MAELRLSDIASVPINATDFAGLDARFSIEFEALESEINKGSSLQGSASINWNQVVEDGSHFIQAISKDLRVAVWLAWASYQTRSAAGLVDGLDLLTQLIATAWPDLHPRKARTRQAAIAWFISRLETIDGSADIQEHWADIEPQLVRLADLLQSRLEQQTPLLQPVIRTLRQHSSVPAAAAAPVPVSPSPIEQVSNAPEPRSIGDAREAHRQVRQLQEQSRILCSWWGEQSPGDARALRLARTMMWLPIDELPVHDANGITALRPLPADRIRALNELVASGQYVKALSETEVSLARSPFWLDGQLLVWRCLDALGKPDGKAAVTVAMQSLLQRLPLLPTLRFFDGTEFAAEPTRAWIERHCSKDTTGATSEHTTVSTDAQSLDSWSAALLEAKEVLGRDGLAAALRALRPGSDVALGSRQAFLWRMARARLCIAAGQRELAVNLLEAQEQELRASGLACWEPELLLEVSQLLYWCYDKASPSAQLTDRKGDLFRKLCHLDLEVVLDQA